MRKILPNQPPDVHIKVCQVPSDLGEGAVRGAFFQAKPSRLLLTTRLTADYLIEGGNSIQIAPKPESDNAAICHLAFGWATGGLLIQRGILALHGSTIATPSGAVVFCGDSGVGKSTLVGLLLSRGMKILDDNIAALDLDSGQCLVQPGGGSLRLMPDSLDFLQIDSSRLIQFSKRMPKYLYVLNELEFCAHPIPLRKIYFLHRSGGVSR
ncbi:MAG: hypothetical protein HQL55_20310, partial [Magnetococcales bacterium]|nr:hypothetical protein [Magnetococcales bacterium]